MTFNFLLSFKLFHVNGVCVYSNHTYTIVVPTVSKLMSGGLG